MLYLNFLYQDIPPACTFPGDTVIMCPDNPELQYRAEFPVHFPLTVLTFSGQVKESVQEILPYTAFPGNFIFFPSVIDRFSVCVPLCH